MEIEEDDLDMFVSVNGVTIARRDHPVPRRLAPGCLCRGWTVTGREDDNRIEIRIVYDGTLVLH